MRDTKFYVYVLLNPSRGDEPFYVGKGSGYRVRNHYCPSGLKSKSYKNHIIKQYRELGFEDKFDFLDEGLTEDEANIRETFHILRIGRKVDDSGPLVNLSTGGEGTSGHSTPRTEEWKRKISEAHKGKIFSAATRERMSKANVGRKLTEEHKEKISLSMKGRTPSEEHRRNLALSQKGRKLSEEHIAKISCRYVVLRLSDGKKMEVQNLRRFCVEQGIFDGNLRKTLTGEISQSGGYRLIRKL